MKTLSLLAVFLLSAAASAQAESTLPNLVKCGDFEQPWTTPAPPGWLLFGTGPNLVPEDVARDTNQFHGGQASFRVHRRVNSAPYPVTSGPNIVEVRAGMTYEVSFWAKSDIAGMGQFTVMGFTSMHPQVSAPQVYTTRFGLTTDWKRYAFDLTAGRDFATDTVHFVSMSVAPVVFGDTPVERNMWLDDVAVTGRATGATAESVLTLAPLFSDGMVLQRDLPIKVWGLAPAGKAVTVSLNGKTATATADAAWKWSLQLPAFPAGGPYEMQFQAGQPGAFVLRDVLIGDVWLASGQSNMEFQLGYASTAEAAMENAFDPQLRMYTIKRSSADTPQFTTSGSWQKSGLPAGTFSAVGYFFARELRKNLNVPIGIIHSSYGGSAAQTWVRKEVLAATPENQFFLTKWDQIQADMPRAKEECRTKLTAWQTLADQAKAEGKPVPPGKPTNPESLYFGAAPSGHYNSMIAPLIPFGIKGVIWYQGESNAGMAQKYAPLFPALIANWRTDWGQGDFPFLFVQLPNFMKQQEQPVEESGWAEMREVQEKTLSVPNTGMAVTIDLGEAADIHPKNKETVGTRLGALALAQVYGKPLAAPAPRYDGMAVEGSQIRIKLRNAQGLNFKGDVLKGFAIAGADKKWVWADGKIDGESVLVSSPQVPAPLAVRYDWANNPVGNLYNGAGLPASSFRTDG